MIRDHLDHLIVAAIFATWVERCSHVAALFQDALEMESEKKLLQRFISEAQELRVICTVGSDFKTPAAWREA